MTCESQSSAAIRSSEGHWVRTSKRKGDLSRASIDFESISPGLESYFWNLVTRNCEKGRKQFVYGLLCGFDACPVAVEVFSCNMSDPQTFSAQVENIRRRFGLEAPRVAMVGDRGMITSARIRDSLRPAGMDLGAIQGGCAPVDRGRPAAAQRTPAGDGGSTARDRRRCRAGRANRRMMAKLFEIDVRDDAVRAYKCLSRVENIPVRDPPDLRLRRGARPGARVPVHARLLRRMAHAREARAATARGRRSRRHRPTRNAALPCSRSTHRCKAGHLNFWR